MTDFPAAHSMDTAWFAIDKDGHVALFETGESGCVPEPAYTEDCYSMEEEIRKLPTTGFKWDFEGVQATSWSDHVEVVDGDNVPELYMFLTDTVPVKDLLDRLQTVDVGATTGSCVRLVVTDRAAFAELHARGACAGCYSDYRSSTEIASHGIYRYEHTCENWIAGPYARASVPTKPLSIDQVPLSIRKAAIPFEGRFADTPKLQPAEHWRCTSWESGWLSSDGKTARPFEDQAEQWAEYAADRGDDGNGEIKFVDEPADVDTPPAKKWWKTP